MANVDFLLRRYLVFHGGIQHLPSPKSSGSKKKKKKSKTGSPSTSPGSDSASVMAPPPPAKVGAGKVKDSGGFQTPTKNVSASSKDSSARKTVTFGRNISKGEEYVSGCSCFLDA